MPRVDVSLTAKTFDELREFLSRLYPGKRALSLVVEQAIKEYLERNNKGGK